MSFHKLSRPIAAALLAAIATAAPAQDAVPRDPLLTRPGWEIGGQVSWYEYKEPATATFGGMSLEGPRIGVVGAYTGVRANRIYGRIDGRVSYGRLDYESGGTGTSVDEPDWTAEIRGVIGRDYVMGERYALSPYIGLGYRYLYNDGRGTRPPATSATGAIRSTGTCRSG